MRYLGVLLGLTLALFIVAPVSAASPNVGSHIHVEISNDLVDGVPLPKAPYTFHIVIKAHDMQSTIKSFRIGDSSNVIKTVAVSLGPCVDCTLPLNFTVDFTHWATGRHELRWTANINPTFDGKRHYNTSRDEVCIGACTPNLGGRAANWLGGGGWYTGHDYIIALLKSARSGLVPNGSIVVASQYSRSTSLCVFLNPNFHAGSHGLGLGCFGGGTANHTVGLPASLADGDNLVIVSSDGFEAGVLHVKVGVPEYLELQSWWAKTGLVLP